MKTINITKNGVVFEKNKSSNKFAFSVYAIAPIYPNSNFAISP